LCHLGFYVSDGARTSVLCAIWAKTPKIPLFIRFNVSVHCKVKGT